MMIEVDTVKGFQDYLPPESSKREAVRKLVEKYFNLYGFIPIETPIVELDELMKPNNLSNEDEAISDRFKLKDKGGRNLGLRYEFTFQLARIFKQNPNIKLPFRRYQIGEVFRDEPVSSGRFRQFTQCDADIIGENSSKAEAECLSMIKDILKELKIDAEIQVNNRRLLSSIIESVQISQVKEVMKELDKLGKLGEDAVKANLRKYASANQILTLFKLLEKPLDFFIENAFEGSQQLYELIEDSKLYNLKLNFNPSLARGLGYYTGNIFEVKVKGEKNSIAAGGRYDKLIGKYVNKEIPAFGISFGLERLTNLATTKIKNISALVISIEQEKESIKLANKLRKEDVSCIIAFGQPGKQLEYANSIGIPYAIFIGAEELAQKKLKLRNMASGEEKLLTEKQLINILKKI